MILKTYLNNIYSTLGYSYLAILSCFAYGFVGYFTSRSNFSFLILLIGIAFLCSYFIIEKSPIKTWQLFCLALIYRLVLIFAVPNLSQDFFRFNWDGQLILQGLNPYLENVNYYFTEGISSYSIPNAQILKEGMGELSAKNYSNYPPVSQFIYTLASWFSRGSIFSFIIGLRLILICFDLLFIVFARKFLMYLDLSPRLLYWYILNPLCVIEITGNLHLEGVMITLFTASIYFLMTKKYLLSGILISLSFGTKLLSIIAVPLVLMYLWKKNKGQEKYKFSLFYILGFLLTLCVQFLPFFNVEFVRNISESIGLWFNTFEFNASIYYLVREIGYAIYGYNIIKTYGAVMPIITALIFIFFTFKTKPSLFSVVVNFMWMLFIYFILSTTVHPWYLLFPLALSVFTRYRFIYVWSFLVFLSYYSYKSSHFQESFFLTSLEYILVMLVLIYELRFEKSNLKLDRKLNSK